MRYCVPADVPLPSTVVVAFAALFGAIIGSFLNVCILRWGAEPKQSVMRPRSRCPTCGRALPWYENIPVVSWLVLRGRCSGCRNPISVQYPMIEAATALIWAYMASRHGLSLEALRGSVFLTILLGIAITDARAYIIPDEFSLGGLVIGLIFAVANGWSSLWAALLGAAVGFAFLWIVAAVGGRIFKQDAMGGGDIKMMAMVGAFVGWQGMLLTVFLGAFLGSLVFVPLALAGRKQLVPFGIFLSLGALVTYLVGQQVIRWYTSYLTGA
jgi:leader peptidase (prepilin peptidase) / N-methyltransferase